MDFLLFPSCQVICAFLPQKCYFALYCFLPFPWLQSKINTLTSSCTQGEVWTQKKSPFIYMYFKRGYFKYCHNLYLCHCNVFNILFYCALPLHFICVLSNATSVLFAGFKKDPILNCCTLKHHPKDPTFHVRRHWVEYRTRRVK